VAVVGPPVELRISSHALISGNVKVCPIFCVWGIRLCSAEIPMISSRLIAETCCMTYLFVHTFILLEHLGKNQVAWTRDASQKRL